MRIQLFLASAATLIVAAASISVSAAHSSAETETFTKNAKLGAPTAAATSPISPEEAARLAKQASFGPTTELINSILDSKYAAKWLEDQISLNESTYEDLAKAVPDTACAALAGTDFNNCYRDNFTATPVEMRFYANAIGNNDQLRQRVAFALSQIIVASELKGHSSAGLSAFNQIFLSNSFGNYRDILRLVTLSPYMGDYLDMADSKKSQPNENYAREMVQLFSMGTVLLNQDGSPQMDSNGDSISTYSNSDIKEISRALTGWTWSRLNGAPLSDYTKRDSVSPMMTYAANFDTGAKTFLGKTIPANATQQANVEAVVDTVFNHPNTGPFISKRLIQQLTVANPTPAYIARVAAVFADNGSGVRGDMKALIRAIYLDDEARGTSQLPGKVKEPVLLATSLARAIGYKTDGYAFLTRDAGMGQQPFRAPSVFNFYPNDYPLPQGNGLVSPVSKLMNTATVVARHNFIFDWTVGGDGARSEFQPQATISGATGTIPNWASWEANGTDDGKTVDRINLVMLNNAMTLAQRQALLTAMSDIKNTDPALQARKRAQMALYVVASSPLFQVDR